MNIDSSNIDEVVKAKAILEALVESESKHSLNQFMWNYDCFELDDFIVELLELLGDANRFSSLERIELKETIESK